MNLNELVRLSHAEVIEGRSKEVPGGKSYPPELVVRKAKTTIQKSAPKRS